MSNLLKYFDEFINDLKAQLEKDDERWGNTWKKRNRKGQVQRFIPWFNDMTDQLENGNLTDADKQQMYLKLAGGAFINWIRDKYPDTYDLTD